MVVIDTSVVYKWFAQKESDSEIALKILNEHILGKETIIVPSIALYEIVNALVTKVKITFMEIKAYLKKLEEIHIQIVEFDYNLMGKAGKFAKRYNISVYDASFVILARERKCNLITSDKKFAGQIKLKLVKLLKDIS